MLIRLQFGPIALLLWNFRHLVALLDGAGGFVPPAYVCDSQSRIQVLYCLHNGDLCPHVAVQAADQQSQLPRPTLL